MERVNIILPRDSQMANVSELIEQLADANLKQEKSSIITQLGELRDEEAIPILVSCLEQDDDIEIKGYAANALMNYSSNILTDSLVGLLKSDSWVTRMKAVEILGEFDDNVTLTSNYVISPFVARIPYHHDGARVPQRHARLRPEQQPASLAAYDVS